METRPVPGTRIQRRPPGAPPCTPQPWQDGQQCLRVHSSVVTVPIILSPPLLVIPAAAHGSLDTREGWRSLRPASFCELLIQQETAWTGKSSPPATPQQAGTLRMGFPGHAGQTGQGLSDLGQAWSSLSGVLPPSHAEFRAALALLQLLCSALGKILDQTLGSSWERPEHRVGVLQSRGCSQGL